MKIVTTFSLNLLGALLIVIASAAIAAAQTGIDTCAGFNATVGGTRTPLTNTTSTNGGNTAYGASALENNLGGAFDTAIGESALEANTSGFGNTAVGASVLSNNTSGSQNTATGNGALENNVGIDNTANGSGALGDNTTGGENTATGELALTFNTTGKNNTATGAGALEGNSTGNNNTAIGGLPSKTTRAITIPPSEITQASVSRAETTIGRHFRL